MTDEERYTFSSLMTLLIESERKLHQLYETTAEETSHAKLKSFLSDSGKNSLKRMKMMQRAHVENVMEMMLEPLTGLNLAGLLATIDTTVENTRVSNIEKTVILERTMSELYASTSPKIVQISTETSELLMALSRQSMELLHELEQYITSG